MANPAVGFGGCDDHPVMCAFVVVPLNVIWPSKDVPCQPSVAVVKIDDSIPQKHIAEFFALLGGGVKEPGWLNTQLSQSRLAVVPGYSHYNFITSPEVPQI